MIAAHRTALLAAVALLACDPALALAATKPAPVAAAILTAAQVKAQIVCHRVAAADGGMTWYYNLDGKYDADDGRNARGGVYQVRRDGRLCWTENSGISGCFQYYRKAGRLQMRRADPGHAYELGAIRVGPL